jgi:hypothetical protein
MSNQNEIPASGKRGRILAGPPAQLICLFFPNATEGHIAAKEARSPYFTISYTRSSFSPA